MMGRTRWSRTFSDRFSRFDTIPAVTDKGVASMRQDEAIASSCVRRRQIFALCSTIRLTSILINIQVATENAINFDFSR